MNYGFILSVTFHVFVGLLLTLEIYSSKIKKLNIQQPIILDLVEVREVDNIKTTTQKAKLTEFDQQKAQKFYKAKEVIKKTSINSIPAHAKQKKEQPLPLKKVLPKNNQKQSKTIEKTSQKNIQHDTVKHNNKTESSSLITQNNKQNSSKTKSSNPTSIKKNIKKNDANKIKQDKKYSGEVDTFAKTVMQTLETSTSKKSKIQTSASNILGDSKAKFSKDHALSVSEASYVRAKISQNWNTTYFTNAQNLDMWVELYLKLNHSGEVYDIQIKNKKGGDSQYYQLFIDSALTAVRRASPLDELIDDHYEIWKEMIISFTPQGIIY